MYSLVFFNAVRGSQAEAASQTPSLTSDVTPGQSRAPFCPSSAGIYRTQLLFIEPVHTWVAECVLEPLMPPPPVAASPSPVLNFPAFSHSRSISLFLTLFFFISVHLLYLTRPPFFPARRCFSFLRFRTSPPSLFHSILLSFPSLSLHLARLFSPPFFFLIPLQITSRAAVPVRRQYRQMRTFLLIISLMQSALTKCRISNNYSWNDIKGWALLFFFFFYLTYRAARSA